MTVHGIGLVAFSLGQLDSLPSFVSDSSDCFGHNIILFLFPDLKKKFDLPGMYIIFCFCIFICRSFELESLIILSRQIL